MKKESIWWSISAGCLVKNNQSPKWKQVSATEWHSKKEASLLLQVSSLDLEKPEIIIKRNVKKVYFYQIYQLSLDTFLAALNESK